MPQKSRQQAHADNVKKQREKESHMKRVASLARKTASVTSYQKMAMQILDKEWILYVMEKPILNPRSFYLIDIYIPEQKICIEIDGASHDDPENKEADRIRDEFLQRNGYWTFRIKNHDVRRAFLRKIKFVIRMRNYWMSKK